MTEIGGYLRTLFTTPLEVIAETILAHAPLVGGALLIMLVGWLTATLVRRLARHVLRALGVDVILGRIGLTEQSGAGRPATWRPSQLIAQLIHWVIIFVAIMAAFDMLGLAAASNLLQRVVEWIPRLLVSLALLALGLYVTNILADAAERIAASARIPGARKIGLAVRLGLLAIVGLTIMQELGLQVTGLVQLTLVAVGALALAAALALGLGGREFGADILAGISLRAAITSGQRIVWDGEDAVVLRVLATHSELKVGERRLAVPNRMMMVQAIELTRDASPPSAK